MFLRRQNGQAAGDMAGSTHSMKGSHCDYHLEETNGKPWRCPEHNGACVPLTTKEKASLEEAEGGEVGDDDRMAHSNERL